MTFAGVVSCLGTLTRGPTARKRPAPSTKRRKRPVRLFEGYEPHAKQVELHACDAPRCVVVAGRRSGKTYAAAREFVRRVFRDLEKRQRLEREGLLKRWRAPYTKTARGQKVLRLGDQTKPALHYWIVAPTYSLAQTALREVFETIGGEQGRHVLKYNASTRSLWLKGGILIEVKSADDEDKLVSSGLDGLWVEEAARLKREAWRDNLRATLSDKNGWALFSTTPLGMNWFYEDIWQLTDLGTDEAKRVEGWRAFHFTTADNTAIPALAQEMERAAREMSRATWLRNYKADFNAYEGKIYEAYLDDSTHLVSRCPATFKRSVIGVDWGFRNRGVALVVGFDSEDDAWVVEEISESGILVQPPAGLPDADCWARRICGLIRKHNVSAVYCDPSEPEHIAALRAAVEEAGLNCAVLPARNAVQPGIEAVDALLRPLADVEGGPKYPALRVHVSCAWTRRGLTSYKWAQGSSREEPHKEDDHEMDALRYAIYTDHVLRPLGAGLRRLAAYPSIYARTA